MNISVVIPCRNSAPYLERALNSVAEQRYYPYEIILVDDGSTDDSVTVARNSGIVTHLLSSDWRNGAGTRNVGIAAATGDWIAFLDADDYWLPNHLEQFVQMKLPEQTVAYLSHRKYIKTGGSQTWEKPPPYNISRPTSVLSDREFLSRFLETGLQFCMPTVLVRRNRIVEVGMLDQQQIRRHDIEMWLRVIHGHSWAFHPTPSLICQIDTPGSISRSMANSSYWFYRALKANADRYAGPVMDTLLTTAAKTACASALTDGTAQDFAQAYSTVKESLPAHFRMLFKVAGFFPFVFSNVNRLRRICLHRLGNGSSSRI